MTLYSPQIHERLLRADCARRPLDWRFQRAVMLSMKGPKSRYPRESDDDLICQYADMLHRLRKTDSFESFERIRKRHPDLIDVHCVYADMNQTELALLDAFMLSQSTDPAIVAKQSGLSDYQQSVYKKMFLDIEDRRDMSVFISTQLLEPAKLRNIAKSHGSPVGPCDMRDKKSVLDTAKECGTMSVAMRCFVRLLGYYTSPVVLEMVYTGFLQGPVPVGRDSAIRFLNQGMLSKIRSGGLMSLCDIHGTEAGLKALLTASVKLSQTEKEEGQIDIIDSVTAYFTACRPRVGKISKITDNKSMPPPVYEGQFEYKEEEIAEIRATGQIPGTIQALLDQTKVIDP